MPKKILLMATAPLEQVFHTAAFIEDQNPGAEYSLLIKREREHEAAARLPEWKILPYEKGAISPWNKTLPPIADLRASATAGVYYPCSFVRPSEYLNVELLARLINPDEAHAMAYPVRKINMPFPRKAMDMLRSGETESALNFMAGYKRSTSIEYAVRSTAPKTPPACVQIYTAPDCNYKCEMCWIHSEEMTNRHGKLTGGRFAGGKKMEMADYAAMIDDLADMGTELISVCSGGEPLLDANLPEIIRRIYERGMDCHIITNGYLMDKRFRKLFISSGMKIVRVSLNAGTSETFAKVHNATEAGFEKVIRNARELVKERDAAGAEWPKVGLSFVISSLNFDEADKMLEIARDAGVDWVDFSPVWFDPDRRMPEIEISEAQIKELAEKVSGFTKEPGYKGVPAVNLAAEKWPSGYSGRKEYYFENPCYLGWYFTQISSFGEVFPCPCAAKVMGNVLDEPFRNIWNGPEYIRMREEMLALPEKKVSIDGCRCFEVCPHVLWNENMKRRVLSLDLEEFGTDQD